MAHTPGLLVAVVVISQPSLAYFPRRGHRWEKGELGVDNEETVESTEQAWNMNVILQAMV